MRSGRRSGSRAVFDAFARASLVWIEHPGIGYMRVQGGDSVYGSAYFGKYEGYARTALGCALNEARIAFVAKHYAGPLVDIGIGCGQFVRSRPLTFGYDINPAGLEWLHAHDLYVDPSNGCEAATFWDSLEHIDDPASVLDHVRERVFVALPVFRDLPHVLRSKHFRPDEHAWYFTTEGFVTFMRAHGWRLLDLSDVETELGREDIRTFAFARDTR